MFDFLVTEVIDKLRPELSDFLLRVSVLPELEAARCAQLADNPNAARLLDEIERLGLFVDVLDAPVRTLRLHDLFREALQRRLQLDRPDDWRALLQRAAALEGDPLRKQAMLLAASCFEEAARALLADGTELNISGAAPTTLRLVEAFPPDFIAGKRGTAARVGHRQDQRMALSGGRAPFRAGRGAVRGARRHAALRSR